MFCGLPIERQGYDPCVLKLTTHGGTRHKTQEHLLFCHADCLRNSVHKDVIIPLIEPDVYPPDSEESY